MKYSPLIYSVLAVCLFLSTGAVWAEQTILYQRLSCEKPPRKVFFLTQAPDEVPAFHEAAFIFINKTLSAAAISGEIAQKPGRIFCMIRDDAEGYKSTCSDVKVYSSTVQGKDSKEVIRSQEELLESGARMARQKKLDREVELRKLKEALSRKINMDALTSLRLERIEAQEKVLSLNQGKVALERSIQELKAVKASDSSQIIERSLANSLYDYQRLEIPGKK